jgi:hypothetical protein
MCALALGHPSTLCYDRGSGTTVIESEQESRPVPTWAKLRADHEDRVLHAGGETFARARAEGRLLSISRAAGLDGGSEGRA